MLQVDQRFEIAVPPFPGFEEPHVHAFPWVEHCLNGPLWYAEVLPPPAEDGSQFWSRFLVTRIDNLVEILRGRHWQESRLYALLPAYMTGESEPAFTRCTSLWRCRALKGQQQASWLFETEQGTYLEPAAGLELVDVVRVRQHWRDTRAEEIRLHRGL
ncbi:hypothetical protein [Variovorax sp. GB1P17]|uniref:hypothetical protein n=1 Tax=Variovorax sp. GB1P17 TaxID=3443740 RepID=UPI003F448942